MVDGHPHDAETQRRRIRRVDMLLSVAAGLDRNILMDFWQPLH